MKRKVDLSIIVLNYNTRDFLRGCLQSVKAAESNRFVFEVIVVDNASTDDSTGMVRKEFPWVRLIVNKKNLGFAAGNNVGVKKAKGRYFLFLNPDTLIQPETPRIMVEFMEKHPTVGAATCRVELPNGQLDYSCHRGFPTPWNAFAYFSGLAKIFPKVKLFSGYTLDHLPQERLHEIDSGCGAFLLVRREGGEAIGWWDEDYFWYGEDLDFCYRLKKSAWKIYFVPRTKIIHYKGVASGIKNHSREITTATPKTRQRAIRASTAVMRLFYQKHYTQRYPRPVGWIVMKAIDLLENLRLTRHSL